MNSTSGNLWYFLWIYDVIENYHTNVVTIHSNDMESLRFRMTQKTFSTDFLFNSKLNEKEGSMS